MPPPRLFRCAGTSWKGIVKLRPTAVFDAQHGGFTTGWSPVSWGSIDESFVNLTIPAGLIDAKVELPPATSAGATVFRCGPLACPDDGQPRAVEHEMDALAGRDRSQTAPQQPNNRLLSARLAAS